MHISDGVLSGGVWVGSYVATMALAGVSLHKMKPEDIPKVAITTSAFFVASLVHIPLGPTSVHLILNGLVGVILGPAAFLSILIGLIFQALLFAHGGITTIGANALMMGIPAILSWWLFRIISKANLFVAGFVAGASGILFGVLILALFLVTTGDEFIGVAKIAALAHLPVMIIEGIITGFTVTFLMKVKPEMIKYARPYQREINYSGSQFQGSEVQG
ncbi:cobalt transporter CbiM [bacterium]|nr:cobalt transporter CbiM [bacterium]